MSCLYAGDYRKSIFSDVLDAYHSDIGKVYQNNEVENFVRIEDKGLDISEAEA